MCSNSPIALSLGSDIGKVRRAELLSQLGLFRERTVFSVASMSISKRNWFVDQ